VGTATLLPRFTSVNDAVWDIVPDNTKCDLVERFSIMFVEIPSYNLTHEDFNMPLFAMSFFEQFVIAVFLMLFAMMWLAKKAATNPAVQKGAISLLAGYFKR
jgi:hypothetical protein